MNNKIIKITLFTLICSLTTTNVYLASENVEVDVPDAPQEKQSQNNNTILKITAAGLTVTTIALGLLTFIQNNDINNMIDEKIDEKSLKNKDIKSLNKEINAKNSQREELEQLFGDTIDQTEKAILKFQKELANSKVLPIDLNDLVNKRFEEVLQTLKNPDNRFHLRLR